MTIVSTITGETEVATAARTTISIATSTWLTSAKISLLDIVAAVEIIITISYAQMIEGST